MSLLLALPFQSSDLLLAAGLAMLAAWLLLRYAKRRRGGPAVLTGAEQVERIRQERGVRGDLEQLMVEIEQLAKRLGAQLDAKAVQLEKLIREAEVRVEELRALTGRGPAPTGAGRVAGTSADAASEAGLNTPRPLMADSSAASAASAASKPANAELPEERPASWEDSAAAGDDDPVARSVYALADAGHAPPEIARRLHEHIGKVELILALRGA